MKTKIYNLIATAALSIISLTANAQNTKSYNVSLTHDNKLLASVERKNSILILKEELDAQLSKLAEYVKFSPKSSAIEYTETIEPSFWTSILNNLETDVKYRPNASLIFKYEQEKLAEEITNELKPMVKFNPAESKLIKQYEVEEKFTEILNELEADVKYKPTAIP